MIVAGFRTEDELSEALGALREGQVGAVETYTPGGMTSEHADTAQSRLPLAMFAAGLLGAGAMYALQVYDTTWSYTFNVGGRPQDSWPAYVTNSFEVGVLTAMLVGFAGYLIANRMPRLYDPVDECDVMRESSRETWFLAVRTDDPAVEARARAVLDPLHPQVVERVAGAME